MPRLAFERARLTDPERAAIEEATAALVADDRKKAEELFRDILQDDASHVAALCGLAALRSRRTCRAMPSACCAMR